MCANVKETAMTSSREPNVILKLLAEEGFRIGRPIGN